MSAVDNVDAYNYNLLNIIYQVLMIKSKAEINLFKNNILASNVRTVLLFK